MAAFFKDTWNMRVNYAFQFSIKLNIYNLLVTDKVGPTTGNQRCACDRGRWIIGGHHCCLVFETGNKIITKFTFWSCGIHLILNQISLTINYIVILVLLFLGPRCSFGSLISHMAMFNYLYF
jgi:hypothetical protein